MYTQPDFPFFKLHRNYLGVSRVTRMFSSEHGGAIILNRKNIKFSIWFEKKKDGNYTKYSQNS